MKQIKGDNYTPSFVSNAETEALEDEPSYNVAVSQLLPNQYTHGDIQRSILTCVSFYQTNHLRCGGNGANINEIAKGVHYLNHLPEYAFCLNKAQTCGHISCSQSSGIILCNNKSHPTIYKCKMFGPYAKSILGACIFYQNHLLVSGKVTDDTRNLDVVVKKVSC
ncbi:hypothetical protein F5Y12DRAFT_765690 [Xylaria sp. FL1777]|nr:hypothetical protein F5Y12DRAFT_765690 [Xylaria sp. FL1777]